MKVSSAATNLPNDLNYRQWGLKNTQTSGKKDVNAQDAWLRTTGDRSPNGPIIAIFDTGVDIHHPDLKNNIWTNPGEVEGDGIDNDQNGYIDDVHGWDFVDNDPITNDETGHGTHVAGIVGAEGNNGQGVTGVMWQAKILPIRVMNERSRLNEERLAEAVEYAKKMGAKVINTSFGSEWPDESFQRAIADFPGLVIASSGNKTHNVDIYPQFPAGFTSPNLIAVNASDDYDRLSNVSNYGAVTTDIAAPGSMIYSTLPTNKGSYGFLSGTSMAAPFVTGAAGLIWSAYPKLTASEVRDRLLGGVDKVPNFANTSLSEGRLNIGRSLSDQAMKAPAPIEKQPSELFQDFNMTRMEDPLRGFDPVFISSPLEGGAIRFQSGVMPWEPGVNVQVGASVVLSPHFQIDLDGGFAAGDRGTVFPLTAGVTVRPFGKSVFSPYAQIGGGATIGQQTNPVAYAGLGLEMFVAPNFSLDARHRTYLNEQSGHLSTFSGGINYYFDNPSKN